MINFDKESRIFFLSSKSVSYAFGAYADGVLLHLYWGKRMTPDFDWSHYYIPDTRCCSPTDIKGKSTDTLPMEYPVYGSGDLRSPALSAVFSDGTSAVRLVYSSHRIIDGKPALCGLPSTYAEKGDKAETLEVELKDTAKNLFVYLCYTVFYDYDVITRSVRVENKGGKCRLTSVMSASVDFIDGTGLDFLHLDGAWGRERHITRAPLFCGKQSVDSKRGASSHHHNPFLCLPERNADEDKGNVYSMSLVYSGNFECGTELDAFATARAYIGINPFGFGYVLEKGESFTSPEAVLVYSDCGLGKMSRIYHKFYRERLARGKFRDTERYVLINNWEATYFNFNEEKLLKIADKAVEMGLDMLVLDDGWFGVRNSDNCSLGDWVENREKLPGGLKGLAEKINAKGLKFGLWFEPEMVSPDSDLYRAHPDWALHINGRPSTLGRNQLILDLSREDVCNYIIDSVSKVLNSANISYVKWDMNRNMTEIGSDLLPAERQGEVAHRYILGLYRVLDTITKRFPDILFESCSSGGGRFDPAMFCYMPQCWTSDDTDALERVFIQYGTSFCYPYSFMGAHVSVCPNHQVGRTSPLKSRGDIAMMGQFGFELDTSAMTDEEIAESKRQVALYRELGPVFHRGDCYRLMSPFDGFLTATNFVSEDGKKVVLFRCVLKTHTGPEFINVKLKGLDPDATYKERESGKCYRGDFLMNIGIGWLFKRDCQTDMIIFDKQ